MKYIVFAVWQEYDGLYRVLMRDRGTGFLHQFTCCKGIAAQYRHLLSARQVKCASSSVDDRTSLADGAHSFSKARFRRRLALWSLVVMLLLLIVILIYSVIH